MLGGQGNPVGLRVSQRSRGVGIGWFMFPAQLPCLKSKKLWRRKYTILWKLTITESTKCRGQWKGQIFIS